MELLDHMTILFSIFLKTLHPIFQNHLTNLQSHQQGTTVLFSLHPYQHLLSLVFFVMAILTEVISHCHLDLHFLNDSDTEHISMYFWPFVYVLWESVYSSSLSISFYFWLLGPSFATDCMSFFLIYFGYLPLTRSRICPYLFPCIGDLFILFRKL